MSDDTLISIVVPVYNVEKYLPKCLDSLVGQTYKNIEIICVNDGSTDGSLKILEKYKDVDDRIVLIDKKNEGVSVARNTALDIAKGEYFMFVDSDDWIDEQTCRTAIEKAISQNSDIVMWSYSSERHDLSEARHIFLSDCEFTGEQVKHNLHRRFIGIIGEELASPERADSLCPVWGKLYKRELIESKKIRFVDLAEIGTYEDGLFNLYVFEDVKKAVYIHEAFYHYRRENDTSVTSGYREQLFGQWQELYRRMYHYIKEKSLPLEYEEALHNRIALGVLGLGLNIIAADKPAKWKIQNIRKILNDRKYQKAYAQLDFQYFPMHWKVFYGCAKHGFALGLHFMLCIISHITHKG